MAPEPTVISWLRANTSSPGKQAKSYFLSFFPILTWIHRYNIQWFFGDLVAGLTVGLVVVPQGMAYAKIAQLEPQFGLYSSFVGVMIYFAFATSKDITIGPVAVMSLLVGNIVDSVRAKHPQYENHVIASAVALVCGCIVFFLGVVRLGFIVDFIPLPAIAAFMTGSAISIAAGQFPALMGISGFDTRTATFKVIINSVKYFRRSDLNAAVGLTALSLLYALRYGATYMAKRQPSRERIWFFINTLRSVFVILLYTLVSYLINRNHRQHPRISILGKVPRGFQNVGLPAIDGTLFLSLVPYLPSAIIVLLIEHIAISKSFGRINNYTIDPNQELIAIGIANIFGPFFGAYPATGSFSRTAIKAKAGVRTPLAGVITGFLVILAIYLLPPMFFYISNASLAAVIIHAVGDLIVSPKTLLHFYRVSPLEFFIFWVGIFVTVFSSIENGIYTTIAISAALLLFRLAKAQGTFLGQVNVAIPGTDSGPRNVYIPLDHSDGSNPSVQPRKPVEGVFIYRLNEGFLYPNANHFTDHMVTNILQQTRAGYPPDDLGSLAWNQPGPRHADPEELNLDTRPILKAIVLDFQGVPHLDITGLQNLVDVKKQLDRYSGRTVRWHFAGVNNPWITRALKTVGFGSEGGKETIFSVALGAEDDVDGSEKRLLSCETPYFHTDLDEAYRAACLDAFENDEMS
ncbi:Sulfate permease 2 [Neolecta irregularis DAH-3]|uniref:Sulfate permease 2 n=1 Tax=Neolecta irregularis (strain DAH-3) TaxID=1198029 RepID=A0A1U7LM36_NEOID|nr:Sulfate permease 2 [Neolecta irregularis DAH-3]|eukprot:OLL23730.1 Sulfate permease 2 [Neolecta irregularis DAH-3]